MTVERIYRCNLCRDQKPVDELTGIHFVSWPKGWIEKQPRQTENHLCTQCVASIQALAQVCGQGFKCDGGPQCGSDHK